ncbi:MAG TPA: hypothetical protein VJ547_11945 [Candidatus Thermoplasmatota archaeon]|nr:hypothetical protein [Candidatus Thermoplasmatota archaeon]
MIISFAWTTETFLAGKKDVTRRLWDDDYAARFLPGSRHDAYDKSPRFGGKKVGEVEIVDVRKEPLTRMVEDYDYGIQEIMREGGLWVNPFDFVDAFAAGHKRPAHEIMVWRVEFKRLDNGR